MSLHLNIPGPLPNCESSTQFASEPELRPGNVDIVNESHYGIRVHSAVSVLIAYNITVH